MLICIKNVILAKSKNEDIKTEELDNNILNDLVDSNSNLPFNNLPDGPKPDKKINSDVLKKLSRQN